MVNDVSFDLENYGLLANGHVFGNVGAYEILKGWAHHTIDPQLDANKTVVDIEYSPLNDKGKVEFSAEIFILPIPLDK